MSSVEKSEIESDPAPPSPQRRKRGVPEGLWIGCDGCKQTVYRQRVEEYGETCPECGHHFYISARKRIQLLLDADSFEEWFDNLAPKDPLGFVDKRPYAERLAEEQARTGMREACIVGPRLSARPAAGLRRHRFGLHHGEHGLRGRRKADPRGRGGDRIAFAPGDRQRLRRRRRMHEGILSLMQMAKVSGALARYQRAGGLFISVLTNPTMGGVAASFASLGDVVLAEPRALIGFAGPRVVASTVKISLPKGFQTSEFLLEHGFIDRIVKRSELGKEIARLIDYCAM